MPCTAPSGLQTTRPTTRMADFEVLGGAIARHAGYVEAEFDGALRRAAGGDGTVGDAPA